MAMNGKWPQIIQGGMGAGVSHWRLAQATARLGQLGVVAGTALDQIMARRLQDGDPDGHVRRALAHFPFPRITRRILADYFHPEGRAPRAPYKTARMHTVEPCLPTQELCVAANFVEIFLAREGHAGPVGINFLEKIQLPHLPSLYGAMLAGVAVVIVGAGIPLEFPAAMAALAAHESATYTVSVTGSQGAEPVRMVLNPADFLEPGQTLPPLSRPAFLPIVSSETLATVLARRLRGQFDGLILEGPTAGGHNAPPRGPLQLTADGQPIYGARDTVNLDVLRRLNVPFWLAGSHGTPERLRAALAAGATGVQVGTPFALCCESGLAPAFRHALIRKVLTGQARIFTDPCASPTGFPFKVAELEGTLSDPALYAARRRICDLGFLRTPYRKPDGTLGYRCAAEPVRAFVAKGGRPDEAAGRKCLCNGLVANVGMPQELADGARELPLITLGDDFSVIAQICTVAQPDFTAEDVIRALLG